MRIRIRMRIPLLLLLLLLPLLLILLLVLCGHVPGIIYIYIYIYIKRGCGGAGKGYGWDLRPLRVRLLLGFGPRRWEESEPLVSLRPIGGGRLRSPLRRRGHWMLLVLGSHWSDICLLLLLLPLILLRPM